MTNFGREIKIDNGRPHWLNAEDRVLVKWYHNQQGFCGQHYDGFYASCVARWSNVVAIRLRTGHPAYMALDNGFEPWGGGDGPPDDWNDTPVLLRGGRVLAVSGREAWQHDVIGYHKKPEKPVVSLPMSKKDALELWTQRRHFRSAPEHFVEILNDLGLIKEPEITVTVDGNTSVLSDKQKEEIKKCLNIT